MADLTNVERNRAGLGALTVNARLNTAAHLQADQLAPLQLLAHEVANGRYPRFHFRPPTTNYQLTGYNAALPSMLPVSAYRSGVACGSSTSPATTRAITTM